MWIKICGIKNVEAALACAEAGADAVGFVFAPGRRQIKVEEVAALIETLPSTIKKVGVFVDALSEEVVSLQRQLGLDLLQFHGRESPQYCRRFAGRAIKAFRISGPADLRMVQKYRGTIRACLLDSSRPGRAGGTGESWNWEIFNEDIRRRMAHIMVIAAGGLNPVNVTDALSILKPDGIDASSGLEREGHKDPELIRKFIERVRRWENEQAIG